MAFCKQCNARTPDKMGQVVPVLITYYKDKSFDFVIKTPPTAVLLTGAAKIKTGSSEPNRLKVGTVSWDDIRTIAETNILFLICFSVESAMKMVSGTAANMGIRIKGAAPF